MALTSSISLFEVLVANLIELFNWSRTKAVLISCSAVFIFGIPSALSGSGSIFPNWKSMFGKDFLHTLDYLTGSWMLPIAALLTTIFIGWVMNRQTAIDELDKGTTFKRIIKPWFFIMRWIAPVAMLLIILQEGGIIDINWIVNYCKFGCK